VSLGIRYLSQRRLTQTTTLAIEGL